VITQEAYGGAYCADPYVAAQRGFIDDVILPRQTHARLIRGLAVLETKCDRNPAKKHGSIPPVIPG